jgi:pimeloyl-ACP methyl ester carboxylesterase
VTENNPALAGAAGSTDDAADLTAEPEGYDEFSLFPDNCTEVGLAFDPAHPPIVERVAFDVGVGTSHDAATPRRLRALRWGRGPIRIVFLHGGAQNAHTWDTVVLALRQRHGIEDVLCIDLPGHGHSDWRADHHYHPASMADDVATVLRVAAPDADLLVGMSLGGITALTLTDRFPELVRRLCMVDVTPGVNAQKAKVVTDFIRGPQAFPSFAGLLARTIEHNPTRSVTSLRRGILHNAHRNDDGTWSWNYDRGMSEVTGSNDEPAPEAAARFSALWDSYDRLTVPLLVLRGAQSPVVDDADMAEVSRRCPTARIEVVDPAGHSIQGDQPLALAAHVAAFLTDPASG